jgi:hypothetical protein
MKLNLKEVRRIDRQTLQPKTMEHGS